VGRLSWGLGTITGMRMRRPPVRPRRRTAGVCAVALSITLTVMVVEVVGGLHADSLALIADAAHMATDALGLGTALLAIHFANRPPTGNRTFGYARAEILAALADCLLLLGVGGYVQECLGDHIDVAHCTFQLEPGGHAEHEAKLCH
jgi:hypothetical protein